MKVNRRQWLGRLAAGGAAALMPFRRAAADSPVAPPARAAGAQGPRPRLPAVRSPWRISSRAACCTCAEHKVARAALPRDRRPRAPLLVGRAQGRRRRSSSWPRRRTLLAGHGPQERADDVQPDRRAPGPRLEALDPALRPGRARAVPDLHRAVWARTSQPGYAAGPGRRDREGEESGRARPEGPEDPRPLPAREPHHRAAGEGRRPALRPDVGRLRARGHSRSRSTSPIRRRSSCPSTASTSATTSWDTIPTGRSTAGTSRATRSCWPRATACSRGIRRRSSSSFTSATTPRTSPSSGRPSTASPTRPSRSARASASWAASRAPRGSSSRSTRTASCSAPTRCRRRTATNYPQQVFKDELYEIYFRFLETEDEYFDYAPAPVPPQGRWRIYGLGLPEAILKKVYHDNAARILGLTS